MSNCQVQVSRPRFRACFRYLIWPLKWAPGITCLRAWLGLACCAGLAQACSEQGVRLSVRNGVMMALRKPSLEKNTKWNHKEPAKKWRGKEDETRNAAECMRNARNMPAECCGMSRNAGDSCGMQCGLWRITKFTITEPVRNAGLQLAEVTNVRAGRGEPIVSND